MDVDWFRNTKWDESIERKFNAKLNRSNLKAQYLRIQASTLARRFPEVTLRLLDQYFEQADDAERAQAHVDRAVALQTLGRDDEAVAAYEAAIAREQEFPKHRTQAHLDLPFFVAGRQLAEYYDRALELLDAHRDRCLFPVDYFKWHAAKALIAADRGEIEQARTHHAEARTAAAQEHSGFDSHPKAGLVKNRYDDIKLMLTTRVPENED